MSELTEIVKTYTNVYGEVMTMKLDSNGKVMILHTDCNDKFEPCIEFISEYFLMPEEFKQISDFVKELSYKANSFYNNINK